MSEIATIAPENGAQPLQHPVRHTFLLEHTYIYVILLVTLVQVVHNSSLMQLSQCRHVLHPIDAGLMHGIHSLSGDLGQLQIQHLEDNTASKTSPGPSDVLSCMIFLEDLINVNRNKTFSTFNCCLRGSKSCLPIIYTLKVYILRLML